MSGAICSGCCRWYGSGALDGWPGKAVSAPIEHSLFQKRLSVALARSRLLDTLKARVKAMSDQRLKDGFRAVQELSHSLSPHWSIHNAIVDEMETSYKEGRQMELIIAMAMRRLTDGLMHGKWLGQKKC